MKSADLKFQNKRVVLFIPGGIDYPVYLYIASILEKCEASNAQLILVDVYDLESTVRRLNGKIFHKKGKLQFRRQIFEIFETQYCNNVLIERLRTKKYLIKKPKIPFFGFLTSLHYFKPEEYFATRSALATKFSRTWRPDYRIFFLRNRIANYLVDFRSSYALANNFIERYAPQLVIFFNGRHPSQAGIRVAVEEKKLDFFTIENGFPANTGRFHFENFQIQELKKMQYKFIQERMSWSDEDYESYRCIARDWLTKQSSNKIQNPFIMDSNFSNKYSDLLSVNNLAVIFSSSVDETINNLGHFMNGWQSQGAAIAASAKVLNDSGYRTVVRIHPNSMNKAFIDLLDLVKCLEDQGVEYLLPWEDVNSYVLLNKAKIVGTWDSRIGLEAAARGIPAFVLSTSEYDLMAGIPIIDPNCLAKLPRLSEHSFEMDKIYASVYQMHNHGQLVSESSNRHLLLKIEELIQTDYSREKNKRVRVLAAYRVRKVLHFFFFFIPRGRFVTPLDLYGFLRLFQNKKSAQRQLQKMTLFFQNCIKADR
jgi:hypothetical protein